MRPGEKGVPRNTQWEDQVPKPHNIPQPKGDLSSPGKPKCNNYIYHWLI